MVKTRSSSIGLNPELRGCAAAAGKEGNFNSKFSLLSFLKRVEKLSESQKIAIERTGFGNLLRIPRYRLSKNLLAELMERWCPDKRAFLLFPRSSNNSSSRTLAITLMDIALILGLRVTGSPVILREDEHFIDLETEYGAVIWNRKICVASIEERLNSIGDAVNEDFVRAFLLFIFGTVLFPNANSKVDSRYLYLLQDLDNVRNFAWGAAVLDDMINWLCKKKETNAQFVGGCLIFLQVWSYEHIDIARPSLLSCAIAFPRACRWKNSGPHQRQWFRMKFKELDKDQVVYKLQLTDEESNIDIVKELLEAQYDGEVLPAQSLNVETDKVDDRQTRLEIIDQWIAEEAHISKLAVRQVQKTAGERSNQLRDHIEPPSTSVILTDYVDLTIPHQVSEGQKCQIEPRLSSLLDVTDCIDLSTPYQASKGQGGQMKPLLSTSEDNSPSVVMISSDDGEEGNIERKEQTLLQENAQLKNEIDNLWEENTFLRDQLDEQNMELRNLRDENKILTDQLEERNAESDDLRQENQLIMSSANDLVTRLERIVLSGTD